MTAAGDEHAAAARGLKANGLYRIGKETIGTGTELHRRTNAMMFLLAVEGKLLRTLTMWEHEGHYYLQDLSMKKTSICTRCNKSKPFAELQGVYFRDSSGVPAKYGPKMELACSACRRKEAGQYRRSPGTDESNCGRPSQSRGPSLSKAAKLAASLGGNMSASIQGGSDDCTVQSPADRRFEQRARDGAAALIAIDRIIPDTNQPRVTFNADEVRRLGESIRDHGQLQPCVVRWDGAKERYVIVAGERRYRGALEVGLKELRCVVWEDNVDPTNVQELQIIENALRSDLAPMEEAAAIRKLMVARGYNGKQVAERLHLSPTDVTRALALLKLPNEVQQHVERGHIAPAVAYEISKAPEKQQKKLAAEVVEKKLTRDDVVKKVRGEEAPLDPRVTKEKCTIAPPAGPEPWEWCLEDGTRIQITPPKSKTVFGILSVEKALRQAIVRVEESIQAELPKELRRTA